MKNLKKLASVALALVMTMALMVPAFAAEAPGDITIAAPLAGKTYTVYKVFDLKYEGENYSYTLPSNSPWMSVIEQYFTVTAQAADSSVSNAVVKDGFSAAAFAKALNEAADKPAYTDTWTAPTEDVPESYTFKTGELGYYFVTSDAGSLCNLTNTNPTATIYDKNDLPAIDKTVNDNDGAVSVGQTLTYEITGKVPSTTGYSTYTYRVADTMSTGLTFNENVTVSIGGTAVAAETVSGWVSYANNGFVLNIPVMDYQNQVNAAIVVSYTATVNSNAVTEVENTNEATLTYSNDPTGGTDTTPEEIVKVYVAKIVVDKVVGNNEDPTDMNGEKLNGATFVLQNEAGKYYNYENGTLTWVDEVANATPKTTAEVNGTNGYAEFVGLGNGTYKLIETEAPNGYNLMTDPVTVTITGADSIIAATNTQPVANFTGAVLPSTGGMGTTIFYVVGGVLLVGSAILFVTKKRMGE